MKTKLANENFTENYMENLMKARGVEDFEQFINPTKDNLQSWTDLTNIREGVTLIDLVMRAEKPKRVAVIVDCDIDGETSATIIYKYLKRLSPEIEIDYYLHEEKQHGLEDVWKRIAEKDYNLLIIPDAGTNDGTYAEEIDCPILVIDHHILEDSSYFPDHMVVVNNQTSPAYKNKDLSGAGMVYQFCRALDDFYGVNWADDYIDLAAVGICGDMMSGLQIENQYIWKAGFSNLQNLFLKTIARKQAFSIAGDTNCSDRELAEALTPTAIAFYIVPMINAMIRVGTMEEKERLFLAFIDGEQLVPCNKRGAKGTMEKVAIESARECTNARLHQNKTKEQVVECLEQKIFKNDLLENKILFIKLEDEDVFPKVLNGLVSMQLSNKYKKPTIVARLNDQGYIRGSARGLNESELASFKNYLNSTSLFEYTAGHDNAFGISIKDRDLDNLHAKANVDLEEYDFDASFYEVNFVRNATDKDIEKIVTEISRYTKLWSHKNNQPIIGVNNINLAKADIQIIGKNKDTIKFLKNGITYMKFKATDMIEEIDKFDEIKMEITGTPNMNYFGGNCYPQIFIKGYEIHNNVTSITDF